MLTLRQELNESGLSTYEATFIPDDPARRHPVAEQRRDRLLPGQRQRRACSSSRSRQCRPVRRLVELLRRNEIEVTVRDTRRPFDNLADLQQFDAVILADVPGVSGDGAEEITQFTDEQIRQLVQNTQHFGCGLIVLGGPNSFVRAAGRTPSSKRPCRSTSRSTTPRSKRWWLVLVVDSSGSMAGEKIAWAKAAAVAAAEMLGRRDYIGVVAFDSEARWVVPLHATAPPAAPGSRIRQLGAGGGTDMMPGLEEGYRAIKGAEASIKHVIALTDGQTPPAAFNQLAAKMRAADITTSGVAVGPDADRTLLAEHRQGGRRQVLLP